MKKKLILDQLRIERIVRRIAYQIYENNLDAGHLGLIGIGKTGQKLCEQIQSELEAIDRTLKIDSGAITLDKEKPKDTVVLNAREQVFSGTVVLVDDVLYTGRTIIYSLQELLKQDMNKIEIAVLVDRGHRKFPVSATYAGYALATTIEEHVEVALGKKAAVYLY